MSEAAYQLDYDPAPIHSQRIGFTVQEGGFIRWSGSHRRYHQMSWPLAKLTMYQDHLEIKGFPSSYVLGYEEIVRIRRFLFLNVRIEHRSPDVPSTVLLWGWGLASAIDSALSRIAVHIDSRL